jgi:hypothetical protein
MNNILIKCNSNAEKNSLKLRVAEYLNLSDKILDFNECIKNEIEKTEEKNDYEDENIIVKSVLPKSLVIGNNEKTEKCFFFYNFFFFLQNFLKKFFFQQI